MKIKKRTILNSINTIVSKDKQTAEGNNPRLKSLQKKSRFYSPILAVAIIAILFQFSSFKVPETNPNARQLVDYVDPFIGTDFFGHTFPGATSPYGMVQLSPDNHTEGWTYSSGYSYPDNTIMGFSHTHLSGTGYTGCGDVLIMPTVGDKIKVVPGPKEDTSIGYRSKFSHENEWANPGYYAVMLEDYNIKAELTTTKRVGFHRYTFPKSSKAPVIMDLGHTIGGTSEDDISKITIINDSLVTGVKSSMGVKVYFAAEFSKPFKYYGTFDAGYATPESGASVFPYKNEEIGRKIGAFLIYETEENEQVLVKVGISFVSIEGAQKNLDQEVNHWDFDKVKQKASDSWNKELSKLKVVDQSEENKEIFYTAVYHSLLAQQTSQDVDGQYFGMDEQIHKLNKGNFYPSFSCWDTYRSEHPLMTLIARDQVNDIVRSIIAKTKEYGWFPAQHFRNEFGQGMVGDHLIPIIVDAYLKGYRDYDAEFIYEAMKTKALGVPPAPFPASAGRSGITDYINLGYAPCDKVTESVPNTLELAYNDWCIAQMAKAMGKEKDYNIFIERANNYKNLFDAQTAFFRPKKADGTWLPELMDNEQTIITVGEHSYYKYFDPLLVGRRPNRHYTESNAWQYLWSVQHDPKGLIDLLGGNKKFDKRLDEFFQMTPTISGPKYVGVVGTIGQYVHGNQPSHHVAYLYNYVQKPWKTQQATRKVMKQLYRTGPGGLPGNEDMGSLSSWYVLSAMGFYPVSPGSTQYTIGSPIFNEVNLDLGDGKTFSIKSKNNSSENVYIQGASLNGKTFNRTWIDHSEITAGGTLEFTMGPVPNKSWASNSNAVPFSMNQ
ncbi:GH92 family glycosyl hydrolase [Flexithrix dorotheae]|uniref:GH92 family glycosyl hydrolase n=1 Tax=Flexithrix dorotheae TaxID=70993 RepID=UPI00036D599E|nr:GH92 family glycosyl hydrolase [Flexithrix dorotheae]